jgi:hypothetical protein
MLNNAFPFIIQPGSQAIGPGDPTTNSPVVLPFEGFVTGPPSAQTLWIDDVINLFAIGY